MVVLARTRRGDRPLRGPGTLLACCEEAGLPLASACSGRGACGRCLISVLEGASTLEAASATERAHLTHLGAEAHQRRACQTTLPQDAMGLVVTTGYW